MRVTIEANVTDLPQPFGFVVAWLVGRLKAFEKKGLIWEVRVDGKEPDEVLFEEPPEDCPECQGGS